MGLAIALACAVGAASPVWAAGPGDHPKLDPKLNERANKPGRSRVIVILKRGANVDAAATALGGKLGKSLELVDGKVLELPNVQLTGLANLPGVVRIVEDRPTGGEMNRWRSRSVRARFSRPTA